MQIASAIGASVVGVCSQRNVDFVTKCGAADVVDYGTDDCIARIAALGPYDLVLDCVSSADARDKLCRNQRFMRFDDASSARVERRQENSSRPRRS